MNGKPFALFLMAFGGAMIIVALMQRNETRSKVSRASNQGSYDFASSQDAVDRYRSELGDKLNRDRIAVQHHNIPDMRVRGGKIDEGPQYDPVLNGVPLKGEKAFAIQQRTRIYKDLGSEIRARVAFEENLRDWEAEARAQYLAEFIANAEKMGYKVEIDEDYNVKYEAVGGRSPQSFNAVIPSFLRAPLCLR